MTTWRDRARAAMKNAGIVQEALAEALAMTTGGAQKWLAGTRQPSLDDINRIAAVLNVSPAWLTHGLDADDMLDGLPPEAKDYLRRLVKAQRQGKVPPTFWATAQGMADLSNIPTDPPIDSRATEHRTGTDG